MAEILELKNPIYINGEEIKQLSYDLEAITAKQFSKAEGNNLKSSGATGSAAEIDYGFHMYLGFEAIIALNPHIDITDLERITGRDLRKVMNIGRDFFISTSEEPLMPEPCDVQSENTQEPITQALEN